MKKILLTILCLFMFGQCYAFEPTNQQEFIFYLEQLKSSGVELVNGQCPYMKIDKSYYVNGREKYTSGDLLFVSVGMNKHVSVPNYENLIKYKNLLYPEWQEYIQLEYDKQKAMQGYGDDVIALGQFKEYIPTWLKQRRLFMEKYPNFAYIKQMEYYQGFLAYYLIASGDIIQNIKKYGRIFEKDTQMPECWEKAFLVDMYNSARFDKQLIKGRLQDGKIYLESMEVYASGN